MVEPRDKALQDYRKKLLEHKETDGRLKELREQLKELIKQYEKSENDLKALQSVGQIVGEMLKQLTEENFIVKATNGPRYIVDCRRQLDKTGMFAIRADHDFVVQEDFMKAVRKVADSKKLESKLDYKPV
ncbi:26S protease regulatory subunit S10B [Heterocephalus glaber]|uniref:26S protease regulatory subunit S10B n=1 Tax=Heterocephalus glaber TaxID=10181 RepID=G5BYG2_HETGA|nr:26S protease regulatory subunit S10B [Heterocephalus glaber]